MKKKSQKKAGAKKEDKPEPPPENAEISKLEEETKEATPSSSAGDVKRTEGELPSAEEGAVPGLNVAKSHGRQPSLSVQSKMRSASFRQGSISSGSLSPSYVFSPEGDTAPDIYKKQQVKIEELEKENKRLAKEASDGEKRWKKAEQDLEELREADDDSTIHKGRPSANGGGSSEELAKLV